MASSTLRSNLRKALAATALTGMMVGTVGFVAGCHHDGGDSDSHVGEKHACKGQNSCKGKGNCKTADHGCKGQNSCKGTGGCKGSSSCKS